MWALGGSGTGSAPATLGAALRAAAQAVDEAEQAHRDAARSGAVGRERGRVARELARGPARERRGVVELGVAKRAPQQGPVAGVVVLAPRGVVADARPCVPAPAWR